MIWSNSKYTSFLKWDLAFVQDCPAIFHTKTHGIGGSLITYLKRKCCILLCSWVRKRKIYSLFTFTREICNCTSERQINPFLWELTNASLPWVTLNLSLIISICSQISRWGYFVKLKSSKWPNKKRNKNKKDTFIKKLFRSLNRRSKRSQLWLFVSKSSMWNLSQTLCNIKKNSESKCLIFRFVTFLTITLWENSQSLQVRILKCRFWLRLTGKYIENRYRTQTTSKKE